ncbi:MAG: hypothetical protein LBN99_04635 [Oscillospiraceae bacterium]|jgi:hypothetical protein|nr:hypothetical protein [Oscillospiraceae bacterium]
MPTERHRPTALLPNRIFPSYQLFATAGNGKLAPEKTLVRCVLHAFAWLRGRFRELERPTELVCAPPEESAGVSFADFKSFELNVGYKIETVCLQEEKAWALRLTEPDPGATLTDGTTRAAVAGRIFETNIAFRLIESKVECGFKTVVSEPEGTAEPCEVFRYALVRSLIEDAQIGLSHGAYPLRAEPLSAANAKDAQKLTKWLRDDRRMLPAVVLVEADAGEKPAPPLNFAKLDFARVSLAPRLPAAPPVAPKKREPDVDWSFAMGFAQVFTTTAEFLYTAGDTLLVEPQFSGEVVNVRGEPDARLRERVKNYPVGKPIKYGSVMFVTEAKIVELEARIAADSSRGEMLADFELQKAALRDSFGEKQRQRDLEFIALEKKLASERGRREKEEKKTAELLRNIDEISEKHSRDLRRRDAEIAFLRSKAARPKKPQELAAWAAERFAGQLEVFDSNRIKWGEIGDVELFCDALDYLAAEYLANLLGELPEDEMNDASSVKYNRGFDVGLVTGTSPEVYHGDYHINYGGAERLLDRHLRVGNRTENLLRVYFFFDKERRLIVIGSLPGHLPTVSYS